MQSAKAVVLIGDSDQRLSTVVTVSLGDEQALNWLVAYREEGSD